MHFILKLQLKHEIELPIMALSDMKTPATYDEGTSIPVLHNSPSQHLLPLVRMCYRAEID